MPRALIGNIFLKPWQILQLSQYFSITLASLTVASSWGLQYIHNKEVTCIIYKPLFIQLQYLEETLEVVPRGCFQPISTYPVTPEKPVPLEHKRKA